MHEILYQMIFTAALSASAPAPLSPPADEGAATPVATSTRPLPLAQTDALNDSPSASPNTGLGPVAPADLLGEARGGSDAIASDTRLGGQVSANSASQLVTGANTIDSGSLAGAVGLPVVIQNSGANVLIQNATVVNVQFK